MKVRLRKNLRGCSGKIAKKGSVSTRLDDLRDILGSTMVFADKIENATYTFSTATISAVKGGKSCEFL